MSSTPEGRVKQAIKAFLESKHFIRAGSRRQEWYDNPAGWYYMPVSNGMGVHGIPDFVCCWRGQFLAIEAKAPGKRDNTSTNQDDRLREISSAGGVAIVVDDVSQLEEIFDDG